MPAWLLAACSPKSSVAGWGPEGAAAALSLLLGLEASGSSVTRDMPAEAKLTAVSGIFCLGPRVWRHPSVAAAAAALTDTYWGRLKDEKEAAAANPRLGLHAYGDTGLGGGGGGGGVGGSGGGSVGGGAGGMGDDGDVASGAIVTGAAGAAEALCEAFSQDSFGDKLFARHVAFQLRAGAPAKARAAAWLALRDGVSLHLLPPVPALAPRPGRGDALLFLPPGGEQEAELLELYVHALETGALDKCMGRLLWEPLRREEEGATGETSQKTERSGKGGGGEREDEGESEGGSGSGRKSGSGDSTADASAPSASAAAALPSLPAALALHAATHAVLEHTGVTGAASVLRRLLRRPNTPAVLRGIMHTPLTQRRRPAVARAAAAGRRGGGGLSGGAAPFGPGMAYGAHAPDYHVEARRAVMLAACSDDAPLRAELRAALEAAVPYPDTGSASDSD
jgi:hypothetical protein